MRTFFRVLGVLLLVVAVAAGLLIAFAPTQSVMERSVTINAPQPAVYRMMRHFREWPAWTAWAKMDPTQKTTFSGEDGQPGSTYHWAGKDVGEGGMTTTAVTDTRMTYNLDFTKPFEAHNTGWVQAAAAGGSTVATMHMTAQSPRPMNAMGWLFKGSVEKDFDRSLAALKERVEAGRTAGAAR